MSDLKELASSLLSRTVIADINAVAVTDLYRIPVGKILVVDRLIFHTATATLGGCDDLNVGGGADAASPAWIDALNGIGDMTGTADFYIVRADGNENIVFDGDDATAANRVFALSVIDGADAANGVTVDLFGYLFDS
jgi:hypothetical protein